MKQLTREVLGYPITASVSQAGGDLCVTVLGGCVPHVGSVSVGRWESGVVRVETLVGPGHRDDVVGERFARELARSSGRTVSVTCGIHYEGPTKEDLAAIVACADALLEDVLDGLALRNKERT